MTELNKKQKLFVQEYLVDLNGKQAAIRANVDFIAPAKAVGFYVYLLMDSRNSEIFYVGKGKGRRFKFHETEAASDNIANVKKCSRIQEIWTDGGSVVPVCVCDDLLERDAFDLEASLIDGIGLPNLTNAVVGQHSDSDKAKGLAKIAVANLKPFADWVRDFQPNEKELRLATLVRQGLEHIAKHGQVTELTSEFPRAGAS